MNKATGRLADPIAMEVFSKRLLSITEDMGNSLIRSSFSTNIKERRDCSVAVFDRDGRLIAQASHIPLHLGSLMGSVLKTLEKYPVETMRPGDAFTSNDPYLAGGTHTPDIAVVTPVFIEGEVRFIVANVGHHSDVGGPTPGSISGTARSVFEEGLRLPVIRLARAGEVDEDLLELISHNSREPTERALDLRVQVATNVRGVAMMQQLTAQMGLAEAQTAVKDLLDYTAARLRARIAAMEPGTSEFTAWLDEDGLGGDPVPIRARVTVDAAGILIDFAGSAPQARGAMNVARNALQATVWYSVKALLDPDLLPNSGMFECIGIEAPEGSIVNPRFPAAVGARSITCNKIARAIFGAFAGLLPPSQAMAASHDVVPGMIFSGRRRRGGEPFVYLETIGGGGGARFDADGMDGVHVHVTNTSNLPAEALENEYPLLVEEYALASDSGGSGTYRGGLGIVRHIRADAGDIVFSARSDGHIAAADGVFGGLAGATARLTRNPGSDREEELSSKVSNLALEHGEAVRMQTPGGGGYGPPAGREPGALRSDLAAGKVTKEKALRDYGTDLVRCCEERP